MRRAHALKRLLHAAAIVMLLSACGHTTSVGPERTLRLALTEYRLVPQSVHASPGLLTILVHNEGRLAHSLTVSRGGTVLARSQPVAPGASVIIVVRLSRGRYQLASTLFSDQVLGDFGTLMVG